MLFWGAGRGLAGVAVTAVLRDVGMCVRLQSPSAVLLAHCLVYTAHGDSAVRPCTRDL